MHDALVEIAIHAGLVGLLALVAGRGRVRPGWLAIALALMLLRDVLVTRGYGQLPPWVPDSRWNWTGKLLAAGGLLVVAWLPAFGARRCGLVLRQAAGSAPAWWVFSGLAIALFALAAWTGGGRDDVDTIAFQWTMPGVEEELFYRGVLLLALQRALGGDEGRPWGGIGGAGVLSSGAFGLGHALFWRDGGLSFDALAFALTGIPALLLVWFRVRTGSLVLPVLAHNVANGASTLF